MEPALLSQMAESLTAMELRNAEGHRWTPFRQVDSVHVHQRITDIEKFIGDRLPGDYVDFLQRVDGGQPVDGFNPGNDDSIPCVTLFFSVDRNSMSIEDDSRIENMNKWNSDRRPDELFEFAWDELGNSYCLAIRGPHCGKVFYWDHSKYSTSSSGSNQDKWKSCELTDASFADFCKRFLRGFGGGA